MEKTIVDFKPVVGWRAVYTHCEKDPTDEGWYYISDIVGVYVYKYDESEEIFVEFVDASQDGTIDPVSDVSNLLGVYGPSADESMAKAIEKAIEHATSGS